VFSLKSFLRKSFSALSFKGIGEHFASLGGWGGPAKEQKKKRKKVVEEIQEALPPVVVSRLREEMIAASLTQDVIGRASAHAADVARAKRNRVEEEALLLML